MYTLTQNQLNRQYTLRNENTQQQIVLNGLGDLGEIYYLIQDQLQKAELLQMISVTEMLKYTRANGAPNIRSQTLTNACNRKAIANAVKREGRWYAPAPAFHEWFVRFLARANSGDARYTKNQIAQ